MCSRSICDVFVALSANHNDPSYLDHFQVIYSFYVGELNFDMIYCRVDSNSLVFEAVYLLSLPTKVLR